MGVLDAPPIPLVQKGKAGGVALAGSDRARLTVGPTPPTSPTGGDVWIDTSEATAPFIVDAGTAPAPQLSSIDGGTATAVATSTYDGGTNS